MTDELKPCPFCGHAAKLEDHRLCWFVRCSNCGAGVMGDRAPEPEGDLPDNYWESFRKSAVDKWNLRNSQPPAPWQWLSEARPREGQQCEWVLLAPWGTNSGSGEWVVIDGDVNSGAHFNSSLGRIVVTGFKCEKGLAVTDPAITAWRSIT